MENGIVAINENAVEKLSLDISDYCEQISDIFDKIDEEMSDLDDCIKGSSTSTIMSNYNKIRNNYNTIKKNINNYSEDYACLIRKMNDNSIKLTKIFENYKQEIESKRKTI